MTTVYALEYRGSVYGRELFSSRQDAQAFLTPERMEYPKRIVTVSDLEWTAETARRWRCSAVQDGARRDTYWTVCRYTVRP